MSTASINTHQASVSPRPTLTPQRKDALLHLARDRLRSSRSQLVEGQEEMLKLRQECDDLAEQLTSTVQPLVSQIQTLLGTNSEEMSQRWGQLEQDEATVRTWLLQQRESSASGNNTQTDPRTELVAHVTRLTQEKQVHIDRLTSVAAEVDAHKADNIELQKKMWRSCLQGEELRVLDMLAPVATDFRNALNGLAAESDAKWGQPLKARLEAAEAWSQSHTKARNESPQGEGLVTAEDLCRVMSASLERRDQLLGKAQTQLGQLAGTSRSTQGLSRDLVNLRVKHSTLKRAVASRESEVEQAAEQVRQLQVKRATMELSEKDRLDRQLYRRLRNECHSLVRSLMENPKLEELQERRERLTQQVERLCLQLAAANEELFTLQDDHLTGRCMDLQALLETQRAVTLPELESQLQALKGDLYQGRMNRQAWEGEQVRHKALSSRMIREEELLDQGLAVATRKHAALLEESNVWAAEEARWEQEEREWEEQREEADSPRGDDAAPGAEGIMVEVEGGDYATRNNHHLQNRVLKKQRIAIKPPLSVVSRPLYPAEGRVRLREIASTLFKGFATLLNPWGTHRGDGRGKKHEVFTVTL